MEVHGFVWGDGQKGMVVSRTEKGAGSVFLAYLKKGRGPLGRRKQITRAGSDAPAAHSGPIQQVMRKVGRGRRVKEPTCKNARFTTMRWRNIPYSEDKYNRAGKDRNGCDP